MRPLRGVISAQRPELFPVIANWRARMPGSWLRSKKTSAGVALLGAFVLVALLGPLAAPYDPSANGAELLAPPSFGHLFGTTSTGEDVLSQVLWGARLSLLVGLVAALTGEALAVVMGVTAGYLGGVADEALSLVTNVFLVVPVLPLQILIVSYLGAQSWVVLALVIAATAWPHGARRLRAQTLSLRQRDYIEAARATGEPAWRIVALEILPNLLAIVVTGFLFQVIFAIVVQASLGFLGLGDPTAWSWGTILYWAGNDNAFLLGAWWWYIPPGLCLALLGMGLALVNLGIDEVINPRLRGTGGRAPAVEPVAAPLALAPVSETPEALIRIRDLRVAYGSGPAAIQAVSGVDLELRRGEVLGIAGESGSGKSTLAYAMTRLMRPPGRVTGGQVLYRPGASGDGWVDVLALPPAELRALRWSRVAIVFQAAMSSLNPVLPIETQLTDAIAAHRPDLTARDRHQRAREVMELVGMDVSRLGAYPHQLSGGQRQRAMIAMALVLEPELIVMDEPTTALDVVLQREILSRLDRLQERIGCAVVFITHDLSLLSEVADTIAVMYAGRLVESGPAKDVIRRPSHPYTAGLLASFPSLHGRRRDLRGIAGSPPDLRAIPSGCPFHPRCPEAVEACRATMPELLPVAASREVACLLRQPGAELVRQSGALR